MFIIKKHSSQFRGSGTVTNILTAFRSMVYLLVLSVSFVLHLFSGLIIIQGYWLLFALAGCRCVTAVSEGGIGWETLCYCFFCRAVLYPT